MITFLRKLKRSHILGIIASFYMGAFFFIFIYRRSNCFETMTSFLKKNQGSEQVPCKIDLDNLGVVGLDLQYVPSFKEIKDKNHYLLEGGAWKPKSCQSLQKVAIIIPFRNREEHLKILLNRLHPMLKKQQIDYRIFLVEQYGDKTFNKGKIMNIGFLEALKLNHFDCFIFHDVDLIPESDKNLYFCDASIRHLSPGVDEMRYHLIYENLVGGVVSMPPDVFKKVNGYSNMYWGWGGEDDDLAARFEGVGLPISRPPIHIGRFKMILHKKSKPAENRYNIFMTWRSRWKIDGLNNEKAMKHRIVHVTKKPLYTHIMIDVGEMPANIGNEIKDMKTESEWWKFWFFHP